MNFANQKIDPFLVNFLYNN